MTVTVPRMLRPATSPPPIEPFPTVLLVEDNPIDAMRIQQLLGRARSGPVSVEVVSRLSQAIGRIAAGGVEALLLDLDLPDSRGLDTFRALTQVAPGAAVLVLATAGTEQAGLTAVGLGAQDCLLKPTLSAEGLVRAIRCAVARQSLVRSLAELSLRDELTGLLNRRGFSTVAGAQLRLGHRTGSRFLLLFGDLDGLKGINDGWGHAAGDAAIREAAGALRATFRESDVLGRVGGDEFAVLALDAGGDGGRAVLGRLEAALVRSNRDGNGRWKLGLTLGGVAFDARCDLSLRHLLIEADRALYEEKRRPGPVTYRFRSR